MEGESLFNDGTAAVLFGILVGGVVSGSLGIWGGVQNFLVEVLGGIGVGLAMGCAFTKTTAAKSSIEQAEHDGLISRQAAAKRIEDSDRELDRLSNQNE